MSASTSISALVLSGQCSLSLFLAALGFGRSSSLSSSWVLPLFCPGAVSLVFAARVAARARGLLAVVSPPSSTSCGSGWSVSFVPAPGPAPRASWCGSVSVPSLAVAPSSADIRLCSQSPAASFLRGLGFSVSPAGRFWFLPAGRRGAVRLVSVARFGLGLFGFNSFIIRPSIGFASVPRGSWGLSLAVSA